MLIAWFFTYIEKYIGGLQVPLKNKTAVHENSVEHVYFPHMTYFNKQPLFSDFLLRKIQHQGKKLHRSIGVIMPKAVFRSIYFSNLIACFSLGSSLPVPYITFSTKSLRTFILLPLEFAFLALYKIIPLLLEKLSKLSGFHKTRHRLFHGCC